MLNELPNVLYNFPNEEFISIYVLQQSSLLLLLHVLSIINQYSSNRLMLAEIFTITVSYIQTQPYNLEAKDKETKHWSDRSVL